RVLRDGSRVHRAQQITGVSIAGSGKQGAGSGKTGCIVIAEAEAGVAARVGGSAVVLQPLELKPESDGVLAVHPLHVVLEGEVVFRFIERSGGGPIDGSVGAAEVDGRKLQRRIPRRQTGQSGFLRVFARRRIAVERDPYPCK